MTTATETFRKGDEIVVVDFWNRERNTISVRKMTLTAWGKKEGRAVYTENGRTLKHVLYVGRSEETMGHANDPTSVEAAILRLIARDQKREGDWAAHREIDRSGYEGDFWTRKIEESREFAARTRDQFSVRNYEELVAEVSASR